jgi:hypothetical protein
MGYISVSHKFVAVLNKKVPVAMQMTALGHMTADLAATYPDVGEMRFDVYLDADGNQHRHISDNPFVILEANNTNQIRTLRKNLLAENIACVDFAGTMAEGTNLEQQERTAGTGELDLSYIGIVLFGLIDQVNKLTKKFSLWKGQSDSA